jgi:spore maturation protein B
VSSRSLAHIVLLVSQWSVPLMLLVILLYAHARGVKVYETFVAGAAQGVQTALHIVPYLIAMWVALGLLRSSGALDVLFSLFEPLFQALGIPIQVLPLAVTRPLSGSGALGLLSELLRTFGPDSGVGTLACLIQGSTETTFYVTTVYLGAVGIRKARHGLAAALVGDLAGFVAAVLAWRLLFPS